MPATVENFGRNVRFEAAGLLEPSDENAVLAILEQHRSQKIRAVGSRHSWSPLVVTTGVVVDLRHFRSIVLQPLDDGTAWAEIGGGCTIDDALDYLTANGGYTLPTYGMTGRQTMAGAVSTGTHGSGCPSLSHYVAGIRIAAYDDAGHACIHEWRDGEALRAARCGLGCLGIILCVRIRVEPAFAIEETTRWFDRIEDVLAMETEYPRQQFYLVPWSWRWYAQLRRPVMGSRTRSISARGQRVLRYGGVDVAMNGLVRWLSGTVESWSSVRGFYRHAFPMLARSDMHVVDEARALLMMRHDLYTHVEMELFVPAQHIVAAAAFAERALRWCGGESPSDAGALAAAGRDPDVTTTMRDLHGTYVHDHVVTIRKVMRDETLISMTSGDRSVWYALSFITYQRNLAPFLSMAKAVAFGMTSAFDARPHWGKVFPLGTSEVERLYPLLPAFRGHCARIDPRKVFVNEFAREKLGL